MSFDSPPPTAWYGLLCADRDHASVIFDAVLTELVGPLSRPPRGGPALSTVLTCQSVPESESVSVRYE